MMRLQSARVFELCALALILCAGAQAAPGDASHPLIGHTQQVQARTADPAALAPLPRPAGFERWHAIDRDDYEATELDAATSAEYLCIAGGRSARFHKPAYACHAASRAALAELDFEAAFDYAYIGCARHGAVGSCRTAAAVPLLMGMNDLAPPQRMALRLESLAAHVCSIAGRVTDINNRNVTGRECAHLARQFVRARDPEYEFALAPAARGFYKAIYERGRAARLMAGACEHGSVGGCEEQYELGNHIDPRDVSETVARDEMERAQAIATARSNDGAPERRLVSMKREPARTAATRTPLHVSAAELDESTETLDREAGERMRSARAGRLCMGGAGKSRIADSTACRIAYEHAKYTAQFELALRYASTGCERHRDAASCLQATRLPLHMVAHRIAPSARFASELKRLGKSVCFGRGPVTNLAGEDVTGRACHHYASLLTPGYPFAARPDRGAERYLETVRDAASARTLHQAACSRHRYHESCGVQVARRARLTNGQAMHAH